MILIIKNTQSLKLTLEGLTPMTSGIYVDDPSSFAQQFVVKFNYVLYVNPLKYSVIGKVCISE